MMKRAVIFANGELRSPAAAALLLEPDDWIIAADGGTRYALACGRRPDLVIGDLDSFPAGMRAELEDQGTRFVEYPAAKDETDLELALLQVAMNGVNEVMVLSALGGRLDQTIANIQLLARPELRLLRVRIVDGDESACLIQDEATIRGEEGDRISLIPIGGDAEGVRTSGLAWPLKGETLRFGEGRGVSNVMTAREARITLAAGRLLCVHSRGSREAQR
jgi:thiamine pyrophosphokinase